MIDPQRIWNSKHLPSLPSVAVELINLSNDPEAGVGEVVALVKTDPAISAKILKVINSTFFGVSSRVTSLERAISLLGGTYVTSIALSFYLSASASTGGPMAEHYSRYWLQSVVHAISAELIGKRMNDRTESELFLSGLMMDLGRLAMLKAIPEEYCRVLNAVVDRGCDLFEAEQEEFGFDHAEIGAKLMETWKLPESLRELVRFHHIPPELIESEEDRPDISIIRALATASHVGDLFCGENTAQAFSRLKKCADNYYGMDETALADYLHAVRQRIEDIADQFSAQANQLCDPTEIMAEASSQLAMVAARENVEQLKATARYQAAIQAKQEIESQHQKLQEHASCDPLTQVFNRVYFDNALASEATKCLRSAKPLGVIFSDIDQFKKINDTYGHQFGDRVLRRIAEVFQAALRPSDVLARYGGEEFVVLVSNPTFKGLQKLAERIRQRVADEIFEFDERTISATVSLGAALDVPGRKCTDIGARVLAAADQEMYQAKRDGGNCIHVRSLIDDSVQRLNEMVNQHRFSRWLVSQELLDVPTVSQALVRSGGLEQLIGEMAVERDILRPADVDLILATQEETAQRFGEAGLQLDLLEEDQLVDLLILQNEDPFQLANELARLNLLDATEVKCALEAYITTRSQVMQSPANRRDAAAEAVSQSHSEPIPHS